MSDNKFGRNFRLTIDPKDGGPVIIIGLPLTIRFTVERHVMSQLNTTTIEIYNLSKALRDRIFQDRFIANNKKVMLEVGYDTLYTVFDGNIMTAGSGRDGTNIVTTVTGFDGNFDVTNTMTFQSYTQGKTIGDLFKFLIGQFPNLALGAVGDFTDKINRPITINGNTWDILKKYSNNQVFIDLGKVFVLKPNEIIPGQIPQLSVQTGLLDTPTRDDTEINVTTLLEPRVNMKQQVELKSVILPIYNGQYAVNGVKHMGTISAAVNGSCTSTFNLLAPQIFGSLKTIG